MFSMNGVEYYGQLSFMKAGAYYADRLVTVSPTYAREIQTDDGGQGLGGLLRGRARELVGILNGIDIRVWDPARDERIAHPYDFASITRKSVNKLALQRELGLALGEDRMLLGVVSRLAHQKGIDWLLSIVPELLQHPLQLVVLGSGEKQLESELAALATCAPRADRGGHRIRRSPGASHRGRRRCVRDAVALRAVRPQPDVQPALRHAADRARDRRSRRHGRRLQRAHAGRWQRERLQLRGAGTRRSCSQRSSVRSQRGVTRPPGVRCRSAAWRRTSAGRRARNAISPCTGPRSPRATEAQRTQRACALRRHAMRNGLIAPKPPVGPVSPCSGWPVSENLSLQPCHAPAPCTCAMAGHLRMAATSPSRRRRRLR